MCAPDGTYARIVALLCSGVMMVALLTGCLAEGSFPMVPERLVRLAPAVGPDGAESVRRGEPRGAREWATAMHAAARDRLPEKSREALTTTELAGPGGVVNVWQRFGIDPAGVDTLWDNWEGIEQTAMVASPAPKIEGGHIRRPQWKGFKDLELPGINGALLYARIGVPDEHEVPGSAIVITHGLFGTLDGLDMEHHAQALRRAGHTVMALEMRGHGETNCRHPEYAITFGMYEAGDLIAAAHWLKAQRGATRVGLISFSLTGYEALLMAWLDGHRPVTEFDGLPPFAYLPKPGPEPAFNGGLFVVSAPLGIISLADQFEPRVMALEAPCKSTFQDHVAARLAAYNDPPGHGMWDLARAEFTRAGVVSDEASVEAFRKDFFRFVDLSRDGWGVGVERMENVRVPLLVLHAANDPLGTAQGVAELFGRVRNPNVGVIMLPQGGHMGFSALSADYYYSVMLNFFDPVSGPGVVDGNSRLVERSGP